MHMAYFPQLKNLPPSFDVLIPFYQFDHELVKELGLHQKKIHYFDEKIFLVDKLSEKPIWAQDWWPDTKPYPLESKSAAIKLLKSSAHYGHYYSSEESKIAKSILKELKNLDRKRIELNSKFKFNYFSWTTKENMLLKCEKPFSRYPSGWHEFIEDKTFPPNRAYLKLWELFTVHQLPTSKSQIAIDLGSSPGGWSWVLSQYFQTVYSVDRAELDPKIKNISNIKHFQGDAFKVSENDFKDCSWLFSDIICTPMKTYDLIMYWMKNSNIKNYVCTIKFKGDCDFDILKKLLEIPDSKIIHLYQNKNEVTWIRLLP